MYESKTAAETVRSLGTDREKGLSRREAMERKAKYGANKLKEQEQKSVGQMILEQLNDPLILILVVAMAISLMLHEFGDAVIIVAVVVLNGAERWRRSRRFRLLRRWLCGMANPLRYRQRTWWLEILCFWKLEI